MVRPFDAHSHLSVPSTGEGVRVVCGTREGDWGAVLERATADASMIPMLGLHPWFVGEAEAGWEGRLEALLRAHRAGVGECGLDRARTGSGLEAQVAVLRAQLRLARTLNRPVALHAVRAWGPLLDLLRAEGLPSCGGLVHGFAGSVETARALQALGLHLSFSARSLERHPEALRATAPDRLLLETDEDGNFEGTSALASVLLGEPVARVAARTWENGHRCFSELMA